MIDIHSHILHGLDDGAGSLEETVAMLRMAAEAGTTDIVASPHANLQYSFRPELVEQKITEAAEAAGPTPKIHYGCDFHLAYENIQDAIANPDKYSINHKRYLLVEFSDALVVQTTDDILDKLQASGITPIITHPERNVLLQKRIRHLQSWVDRGILIQVTAQSLLGQFGSKAREFTEALMKEAMVHVVASDGHDCKYRPPTLGEAYRHVIRYYGIERADLLFQTNPRAIVAGEPLGTDPTGKRIRVRRWYHFWSASGSLR